METDQKKDFLNKLRIILWPIERFELKKFLPMAFMLFFILFNYTVLRSLKDALVITNVGAEATSFLKLWGVLPSAVIFMVVYAELVNIMNQEKVFYCITGFFIAFFVAFLLILYPNADAIHPDPVKIQHWAAEYPRMKWFIFLYGKWIYALFFINAEIWGSMMVSLLFWQFANKITSTSEAKRFYAMFGVIANISGVVAGQLLMYLTSNASSLDGELDASSNNFATFVVPKIMIFSIISGFVIVGLFRWMHKYVLTDPRYYTPREKKQKTKLSLGESFKLILSSKYLGLIVLLILCYGISMNLIEGPWKQKVRELYPSSHEYLNFMGRLNSWTGGISLIFFIIGTNILRKFNWFTAAIMTPLMMLVTGTIFFVFSLYSGKLSDFTLMIFGITPLTMAVVFGMIQNILSKSTKYSLFDSTKEMAYIPIDEELKTKGKAAVDVVGGRLGKSGGALILSTLVTLFPEGGFNGNIGSIMVMFLIIMFIWIYAVSALSKEYQKSLAETKE
ncbi:MAG: Npt1/Npt2 family nucleotide transporter [Alphaproteobacteria bacterium]